MLYPCITEREGKIHQGTVNVSGSPSFVFEFTITQHNLQKNRLPQALIVKATTCGFLAFFLAVAKSNLVSFRTYNIKYGGMISMGLFSSK